MVNFDGHLVIRVSGSPTKVPDSTLPVRMISYLPGQDGWEETSVMPALLRAASVASALVARTSRAGTGDSSAGITSPDWAPPGEKAPIDILCARMLDKMLYAPGERDMLILRHEFEAEYPDRREKITSTMIDFGIPHGYTSMARTVGLPSAIGVRLVLEGKVQLTGVQAPVMPEIYEPVLDELEALGIKFVETWETLPPA